MPALYLRFLSWLLRALRIGLPLPSRLSEMLASWLRAGPPMLNSTCAIKRTILTTEPFAEQDHTYTHICNGGSHVRTF